MNRFINFSKYLYNKKNKTKPYVLPQTQRIDEKEASFADVIREIVSQDDRDDA